MWIRSGIVALGVTLLSGVAYNGILHKLSLDLLLPIYEQIADGTKVEDIALVVIDEDTYRTPPFANTPQVAWSPYLADILRTIDESGAAAIGLDLIYPTTLDRADLLPGYERSLKQTLAAIGGSDRLVMTYKQGSDRVIAPHASLAIAGGGAANLRPNNLVQDIDGIVRSHATGFRSENGPAARSFATELVVRQGGHSPTLGEFLLDFRIRPKDIPTASLAEIYRCGAGQPSDVLRRFFEGRVVIIGTALDIEDRHLTARRFSGDSGMLSVQALCGGGPGRVGGAGPSRYTHTGAFIHAVAVASLVGPSPLKALTAWVGLPAMALGYWAVLLLLLTGSMRRYIVALLATTGIAVVVSVAGLWLDILLPLVPFLLGLLLLASIALVWRRLRLKGLFGLYLAPSVVGSLEVTDAARALARLDRRMVDVAFFDLAGFTSLSEALRDTPEVLFQLVNGYLAAISEAVESSGGYVDKFIGDNVMAVWGAVDRSAERSDNAVRAAAEAVKRIAALNEENATFLGERGVPPLDVYVGVNSGEAVVGHVGSSHRRNFTVMGDVVNLAARLEQANRQIGTRVLISAATRSRLSGREGLRRIARLQVKGRARESRVYELLLESTRQVDGTAFRRAYRHALKRQFELARQLFERVDADPVAAFYARKCADWQVKAPPEAWRGGIALESK
jgi:adenylate cyclase